MCQIDFLDQISCLWHQSTKLSVVKAGYSARYRICTGCAQLAQISKRCSTCIHVAAV